MRLENAFVKSISLVLLTLICSAPLLARDDKAANCITQRRAFRVVHEQTVFDIAQSASFFGGQCMTSLNYLSYPLGSSLFTKSIAPRPDARDLDERIADTFLMVTSYPGGTLLYNTVCAGLDLMNYSEEITSIRYDNLMIGSKFRMTGRNFLTTGLFYSF